MQCDYYPTRHLGGGGKECQSLRRATSQLSVASHLSHQGERDLTSDPITAECSCPTNSTPPDTRAGRALQQEPWGFASYRDGAGGILGEGLRVCASVDCGRYDPEGGFLRDVAGGTLLQHAIKDKLFI